MARKLRNDRPGAAFHVMNRGIARRTIFDSPADYRFFLACLARAVRRKEIEVLAYALLRTHFHLFVRSLGGLSQAMQRIQLRHVRRFNRLHRRDGPLLRNRFRSKEVDSPTYGRNVVHYTHENPVLARLCEHPSEYAWSSAGLCATGRIPLWFSTDALERCGSRPGPAQGARDRRGCVPGSQHFTPGAGVDAAQGRARRRRSERAAPSRGEDPGRGGGGEFLRWRPWNDGGARRRHVRNERAAAGWCLAGCELLYVVRDRTAPRPGHVPGAETGAHAPAMPACASRISGSRGQCRERMHPNALRAIAREGPITCPSHPGPHPVQTCRHPGDIEHGSVLNLSTSW